MTELPLISLGERVSSSSLHDLPDAEFLKHVHWTELADPQLTAAARAGEAKTTWALLTQSHFGLGPRAVRKKVLERQATVAPSFWSRLSFAERSAGSGLAELWESLAARLDDVHRETQPHQARKKTKGSGQKNGQTDDQPTLKIPRRIVQGLAEWLEATGSAVLSAGEALMLLELLRQAGGSLPANVGLGLWRQGLMAAGEWASQSTIEEDADRPADQRAIDAGELPWVMGLFYSHLAGAESLRNRGREFLRRHLDEHTDTDGTPRAEEAERLPLWLAPLARATEWGHAAEVPLWDDDCLERFGQLAERAAALCAADGQLALNRTPVTEPLPVLLTAARHAGGSKKDWPLKFLLDVSARQPMGTVTKLKKPASKLKPSRRVVESDAASLSYQSDWARVACLRNHSRRDANLIGVAHHLPLPQVDVSLFGQAIVKGSWGLEVSFDGTPVELAEEWICVCWHSDADGDYLELQYTLDENRRIERQLYLSRTDHFLVMADCISGAGEAVVDYAARWPLVESANVTRHETSRECVITRGEFSVRTFPLALPDDVIQSTAGFWGQSNTQQTPCLELRQRAVGGLYAPVVFDWTPARQHSYADWRTLTVTEDGPKVKPDRAAGHRLRIGQHQLLIYRSLTPTKELRTVLGHHTGHETVIARFDKNGDVKPLLLVE